MKKVKMIYCWILISVILQVAVLAYVNYIYLPGRGSIRTTMYEVKQAAIKPRSFKLPDGAENVAVSFDGMHAAYRLSGKIVIADLDKKKEIKTLDPGEGTFTSFRWLPDREMLIYATKEPGGKSGQVLVSTYDIGQDLERSYPNIKSLPEGSEVKDIELSPLTNIVYVKIQTSETRARIYEFDIMDDLRRIMTTDAEVRIFETMYTNSLLYQLPDGKIRIRYGKSGSTSRLPVSEANQLLGTDDNDNIYAAATDDSGKLTTVYSGTADEEGSKWETIKLDQPLEQNDFYITPEGALYSADKENQKVQAIEGTGVTEYKGELLGVLDSYVVSMDGNKLILRELKK